MSTDGNYTKYNRPDYPAAAYRLVFSGKSRRTGPDESPRRRRRIFSVAGRASRKTRAQLDFFTLPACVNTVLRIMQRTSSSFIMYV